MPASWIRTLLACACFAALSGTSFATTYTIYDSASCTSAGFAARTLADGSIACTLPKDYVLAQGDTIQVQPYTNPAKNEYQSVFLATSDVYYSIARKSQVVITGTFASQSGLRSWGSVKITWEWSQASRRARGTASQRSVWR